LRKTLRIGRVGHVRRGTLKRLLRFLETFHHRRPSLRNGLHALFDFRPCLGNLVPEITLEPGVVPPRQIAQGALPVRGRRIAAFDSRLELTDG
jgi:hypothetical protein